MSHACVDIYTNEYKENPTKKNDKCCKLMHLKNIYLANSLRTKLKT